MLKPTFSNHRIFHDVELKAAIIGGLGGSALSTPGAAALGFEVGASSNPTSVTDESFALPAALLLGAGGTSVGLSAVANYQIENWHGKLSFAQTIKQSHIPKIIGLAGIVWGAAAGAGMLAGKSANFSPDSND